MYRGEIVLSIHPPEAVEFLPYSKEKSISSSWMKVNEVCYVVDASTIGYPESSSIERIRSSMASQVRGGVRRKAFTILSC